MTALSKALMEACQARLDGDLRSARGHHAPALSGERYDRERIWPRGGSSCASPASHRSRFRASGDAPSGEPRSTPILARPQKRRRTGGNRRAALQPRRRAAHRGRAHRRAAAPARLRGSDAMSGRHRRLSRPDPVGRRGRRASSRPSICRLPSRAASFEPVRAYKPRAIVLIDGAFGQGARGAAQGNPLGACGGRIRSSARRAWAHCAPPSSRPSACAVTASSTAGIALTPSRRR